MSDAVERAAEVIDVAIGSEPHERRLYPDLYAGRVAQALADAGLLATPERDREVAALTQRLDIAKERWDQYAASSQREYAGRVEAERQLEIILYDISELRDGYRSEKGAVMSEHVADDLEDILNDFEGLR